MSKLNKNLFKIESQEVAVDGWEDTVTIYPVTGMGLLKLQQLSKKMEDLLKVKGESADEVIDAQANLVYFTVKEGTKATEEDVKYLLDNDIMASMFLTQEILNYSVAYNDKKGKEADTAKKKSKK